MFSKKISKSKNKNIETKVSTSSDNESLDTLSLDNESFISFKTKNNSTVDFSIKSLSYSVSRLSLMTIKRKREQIITSVKDKMKKVSPNFSNDFKNLIAKQKEKRLEDNFLGYYECIIPNNKELYIPKILLSTARIDLHEEKSGNPEKAKRLVLTKIKESPFNPFNSNNIISLFIITGKSKLNSEGTGWTGIKFNELPEWMRDDTIKHLINGTPVKGLGAYKILIKKNGKMDIYKDIKLKDLEENAKNEEGFIHKMTLVGYYMIGIKENYSNSTNLTPEAETWYKEAEKWCQEAEKAGSIEAKLCLGYMYSIGYSKSFYDPQKAKKLFKEVIETIEKNVTTEKKTTEKTNTIKEMIIGKITTKESTTDKNLTEEATANNNSIADKKTKNDSVADKETADDSAADEENEITSKELARIAMRNMAIIYHSSYVIKPFEWKNFIKISKPNDLNMKKLSKTKLNIAIKWYEKSCELGDSQSAYNLGLLYESDHEIKNENEAEKWFKKAIQFDENNLYAKARLGRILVNKDDVNESEKMNGIQMLKYAAENGLVMGQTFLGEAYERGQIGKRENAENVKEAIKFYFKAAEQNNGYYSHVAQFRLRELRALEIIPAGENIENILKLYVNELKYYYNNNEETLKNIH
ncbi:hypothetical protein RclHR1_01580024 [Rhizophagus clarus]|uniref:Sel1 repeat family protein n=1 Tax=Rhizophagus clarus TaxID=94130 RepID=A0A2Z6QFZ4_9GLOM|nr:hypothetical protein RclHR1_01580024 [Rhizophagus clarus]GES78625.1 Sel1 repeat family protein [Rhizophagus clarus]